MGGEVGCGSRCIRRWLAAGYKLPSDADGGTLTTVFMEAWKDRGLEYIRRIARSLELELPMRGRDFDWAKTHNFAPVYATKLAGKDQTGLEDERTPADHLDAARSDCPVLAALLGRRCRGQHVHARLRTCGIRSRETTQCRPYPGGGRCP